MCGYPLKYYVRNFIKFIDKSNNYMKPSHIKLDQLQSSKKESAENKLEIAVWKSQPTILHLTASKSYKLYWELEGNHMFYDVFSDTPWIESFKQTYGQIMLFQRWPLNLIWYFFTIFQMENSIYFFLLLYELKSFRDIL